MAIETCIGCRHCEAKTRVDIWPATASYVCGADGRWIGFLPTTPADCPGREAAENEKATGE